MINIGKNNTKRAHRLINGAASMGLSQSSLIVYSLFAAKEGRLKESANYWFKGKSVVEKSVQWESSLIHQVEKVMSLSPR